MLEAVLFVADGAVVDAILPVKPIAHQCVIGGGRCHQLMSDGVGAVDRRLVVFWRAGGAVVIWTPNCIADSKAIFTISAPKNRAQMDSLKKIVPKLELLLPKRTVFEN